METKIDMRISDWQLMILRHAAANADLWGKLMCDRSTGKSLASRGFARDRRGGFFLTEKGFDRAKRAADYQGKDRDGMTRDPSMMEDLP